MLQNNANAPTQRRTYHQILVTFTEYKNSVEYEADKTFAVEDIQTIASISLKVTEIQTNQVTKYAQIDRQLRLLTWILRGLAAAPACHVRGCELHQL